MTPTPVQAIASFGALRSRWLASAAITAIPPDGTSTPASTANDILNLFTLLPLRVFECGLVRGTENNLVHVFRAAGNPVGERLHGGVHGGLAGQQPPAA